MTAHVSIIYLGLGQRWRRRQVSYSEEWPIYLINQRDRQAHIARDNPIFAKQAPIKINTWQGLVDAIPPQDPPLVEGQLMICEDNSPWPVVARPWTTALDRTRSRLKVQQEARQRAETLATKDWAGASPMVHLIGLTAIGIAAAAGLVTVAIVANKML